MSNGEGSKRRPAAVDRKAFEDAWERTFRRLTELQRELRAVRAQEIEEYIRIPEADA